MSTDSSKAPARAASHAFRVHDADGPLAEHRGLASWTSFRSSGGPAR